MVAEDAPVVPGDKLPSEVERSSTPGGVVAVRPTGGLCNRLRVISSFQLLARYTGRELRLCWAPSNGFSDEDLAELFENEFARIDESEFERLGSDALCLHEAIEISRVGHDRTWKWVSGAGMAAVLDTTVQPVVAYQGLLRLDRLVGPAAAARLPDSYEADYLTEVRQWRPVEVIRKIVEQVAAEFDGSTIGVHARRGDAFDHHHLAAEFRRSSDRGFFERMDQLLHDDPHTTFFLATDGAETEKKFRERYGPALLTNGAKRFVASRIYHPKDNQHDAVVDLFALARTRRILGSSYSSFSRTAADLTGIPLEIVVDDSFRTRARGKLSRMRGRLRARARALGRRLAPPRQPRG